MRPSLVSLWAPLLAVAAAEGHQVARRDDDDGGSTRRRALGSIVVLGSYLYLEGGEHSSYLNEVKPSSYLDSYRTNNTLAISLAESWDNTTVKYIHTRKDDPRPVNNMALWADRTENVLFRWGGELAADDTFGRDDAALWKFVPKDDGTGSWTVADRSSGFKSTIQAANGTATTCGQKAFYLGGYGSASTDYRLSDLSSDTSALPLPGLVSYDMAEGGWINETAATASSPNGVYINGRAVCPSEFSDDGVVVLVGGLSTSPSSVLEGVEMSSMRNISFYDPADETWYWQIATGEVPQPRQHHCAVGVQGRNDTYEIFVYGGNNPSNGTLGDIYILSLPAFEWFRVDVESPPRVFHDCAVVGNRQMLSNGGLADIGDWQTKDEWLGGIGVFDMTELKWSDKYDSIASAYDSPQIVKDWYDNGGLSSVSWSSTRASQIFGDGESVDSSPGSDDGSRNGDGDGDGDGDGNNSNDGGSSTPVGAIAGGVVGGVAFIALAGALFWFWRRRRTQNDVAHEKDGVPIANDHSQSELAGTPLSMGTLYKAPYSADLRSPPAEMPSAAVLNAELPQFNERPAVRHEMQG